MPQHGAVEVLASFPKASVTTGLWGKTGCCRADHRPSGGMDGKSQAKVGRKHQDASSLAWSPKAGRQSAFGVILSPRPIQGSGRIALAQSAKEGI